MAAAAAADTVAAVVAVAVVVVVAAVVVAVEVASAVIAAVDVTAEATATATADATAELSPIAIAIGEAWAAELVRTLRASKRQIVGSWPGTLGEARMRVLARLHRKVELGVLRDLARVVTIAARREWCQVSQPDPEP